MNHFDQPLLTPIIASLDPSAFIMSASSKSNTIQELQALQSQNQSLTKRLHAKTLENQKLQRKIDRFEYELDKHKQLITQLHNHLDSGLSSEQIRFAVQNAVRLMKLPTSSKSKQSSSSRITKPVPSNHIHHCVCPSFASDRPFKCEFPSCGKSFGQKHHLDSHMGTHTGQRFVCNFAECGKSFVRKYNLQEHQKMHTDQNLNRCIFPGCNMGFSSRYSLQRHQNAQHNLKL